MRGLERQIYGGSRLPWLWHALFDGSWLCRCPHSRWTAGTGPAPVELRDADGAVTAIVYARPAPTDDCTACLLDDDEYGHRWGCAVGDWLDAQVTR